MILSSLTEVEERSLALEVRAFGRPGRRHLLWRIPDPPPQRVARLALLLLLIGSIVGRLTGAFPPRLEPRERRPMLELKGVSYRYAGYAKAVLHDIDLTLADGEIVGLVGPNEAGKSTLCLVAAGLAPASIGGALTGTLTIDGEPMAGRKTHELASAWSSASRTRTRSVRGSPRPSSRRSRSGR